MTHPLGPPPSVVPGAADGVEDLPAAEPEPVGGDDGAERPRRRQDGVLQAGAGRRQDGPGDGALVQVQAL